MFERVYEKCDIRLTIWKEWAKQKCNDQCIKYDQSVVVNSASAEPRKFRQELLVRPQVHGILDCLCENGDHQRCDKKRPKRA